MGGGRHKIIGEAQTHNLAATFSKINFKKHKTSIRIWYLLYQQIWLWGAAINYQLLMILFVLFDVNLPVRVHITDFFFKCILTTQFTETWFDRISTTWTVVNVFVTCSPPTYWCSFLEMLFSLCKGLVKYIEHVFSMTFLRDTKAPRTIADSIMPQI